MKVIVDTCVWSLAFRRVQVDSTNPFVSELIELIKEVRVQLLGPIRQELLSGIPNERQFEQLRQTLSAFPDLVIATKVYEEAAKLFNLNRSKGIQGSNTDFLICAVSRVHEMPILTFDKDFEKFGKNSPIAFHQPRE